MKVSSLELLKKIKESEKEEVVVFYDLDSTIYNLSDRQRQILKDFSDTNKFINKYPEQCERISASSFMNMPFSPLDAIRLEKIPFDEEFADEFMDFWKEHFFSNEYIVHDILERGVKEFIDRAETHGAKSVFLTGRDQHRMGEGTRKRLLDDDLMAENRELFIKPDLRIQDHIFKLDVTKSFHQDSVQIIFIDNEAKNTNYVESNLPGIIGVHFDSVHSEIEQPNENLLILSAFYEL